MNSQRDTEQLLSALVLRIGKVRKRLVTEAFLKTIALAAVVVPLYVALYAWLDHIFHLEFAGRLVALILFGCIVGALIVYWSKIFLLHISLSEAANYVEKKSSFQQQLVAAIEYYEQKQDYPYSKELAEHMIAELDERAKDFDFKSTVGLRTSWICSLLIAVAFCCISYLLMNNFTYYSRYMARMLKPASSVAPMPATELNVLSKNIVAQQDEVVQFLAAIKGRVPGRGELVIAGEDSRYAMGDPNSNNTDVTRVSLLPVEDENGKIVFETQRAMEKLGDYLYRFETAEAQSQWYGLKVAEFPKIKNITAKVRIELAQWKDSYTEEVKESNLSVFKNASVSLDIESTQPLKDLKAQFTEGRVLDGAAGNDGRYTIEFKATEKGTIEFVLENTAGLKNHKPEILSISLKKDKSPQLKLVSPAGDYIATNVASIPIEFEVTDDIGLKKVEIFIEVNDGRSICIPVKVDYGQKNSTLAYELELEEYDLGTSDSMIFYANATDVDTGTRSKHRPVSSDPYFIEIRPYRKLVYQKKPPPPGTPPMRIPANVPDKIGDILEYTRAIVKKTWHIAQAEEVSNREERNMVSISDDVEYSANSLELIRNNPQYQFLPEHIKTIDSILLSYDFSSKLLLKYQPQKALTPEKQAYYEIQSLINELCLCLPIGMPIVENKPDRFEMKEAFHAERYEKERIEGQIDEIKQDMAELAKEEEQLAKEFEHFLEKKESETLKQQAHGRDTSKADALGPAPLDDGKEKKGTTPKGAAVTIEGPVPDVKGKPKAGGGKGVGKSKGGKGQPTPAEEKDPAEEKKDQLADSAEKDKQDQQANAQSGQKGKQGEQQANAQGQQGKGQYGKGSGNKAKTNEILRMMRAQQNALQKQLEELANRLDAIPLLHAKGEFYYDQGKIARASARQHLGKASGYMKDFENILDSQYYASRISEEKLNKAGENLRSAQDEIVLAKLQMSVETGNVAELLAEESEKIAKELIKAAEDYQKEKSKAKQQELREILVEAKQVMELLPEDWEPDMQLAELIGDFTSSQVPSGNKAFSNQVSGNKVAIGKQSRNSSGTNYSSGERGGSLNRFKFKPLGDKPAMGINPEGKGSGQMDPFVRVAQLAAREFWSASIKARKKSSPLRKKRFSHPDFYEQENRFYEQVAKYNKQRERK